MFMEKKHVSNQNSKIAVAYVRVSQERQDEDTQLKLVKKYAKENSLELKEIFIEKTSASIASYPIVNDLTVVFKNRPELLKIIDLASRKKFQHLITYSSDRLARDVFQNAIIKQNLQKNKIQIHFTKDGENFTQSEMSQKLQNILACFAEYEAALIGTRVYDMLCQKFLKGEWPGGRAPFGYKLIPNGNSTQLVQDSTYNFLAKEAFNLYSEGYGFGRIAHELSKNPFNINFSKSSIETIISNKTYFGTLNWGTKCGKRKKSRNMKSNPMSLDYNPSLDIAEKENESLIKYIKKFKSEIKDPQFFSTPYILKDLLICSKCGKKMLPKNYGGNKKSVYRCPTKENDKSHNIIPVEDIEVLVLKRLADEKLFETLKTTSFDKYDKSFKSNIEKLKTRNKNLEIKINDLKNHVNNIDCMLYEANDEKNERFKNIAKKIKDATKNNTLEKTNTEDTNNKDTNSKANSISVEPKELKLDLIYGLEKYKHYYNNIISTFQKEIKENTNLIKKSPDSFESFSIKVDEVLKDIPTKEIPNKRMLCFLLIKEVLLNPDTKEIDIHIQPKMFF